MDLRNSLVARGAVWSVAVTLVSGCSLLVTQTNEALVEKDVYGEMKLIVSTSKRMLACVQEAGGACPTEAAADARAVTLRGQAEAIARAPGFKSDVLKKLAGLPTERPVTLLATTPLASSRRVDSAGLVMAVETMASPTQTKLETLYRQASGIQTVGERVEFSLAKRELATFAKSIQQTTSIEGWRSLKEAISMSAEPWRIKKERSLQEEAILVALEDAEAQVTLVQLYLKAYFNNGNFVSLDIDKNNLEASAIAQLKKTFPDLKDPLAKEIIAKLMAQLGNLKDDNGVYHVITKVKDGGFVTRSGAKYSFPGIAITVDVTADVPIQVSKIDFTQVGADVVRVYIEAVGDQIAQLPADQSSTACHAKKANQLDQYKNLACYVEKEQQVKAAEFAKVTDWAGQVEAFAATTTGEAIRGISWISLNNEALAKLIETGVGVVLRKATEKVTWCYYACTGTAPSEKSLPGDDLTTLKFSIAK